MLKWFSTQWVAILFTGTAARLPVSNQLVFPLSIGFLLCLCIEQYKEYMNVLLKQFHVHRLLLWWAVSWLPPALHEHRGTPSVFWRHRCPWHSHCSWRWGAVRLPRQPCWSGWIVYECNNSTGTYLTAVNQSRRGFSEVIKNMARCHLISDKGMTFYMKGFCFCFVFLRRMNALTHM